MVLPDKFKFMAQEVSDSCIYTYEATAQPNSTYEVEWKEDGKTHMMVYSSREVGRFIRRGDWKILAESFPDLLRLSSSLSILINEREEAVYDEGRAQRVMCELVNRLLDGGK